MERLGGLPLVTTGEDTEIGIDGAIMQSRDGQPHTVNTIEVASVDHLAAQIVEHGGQVVVPKMSVPGVGYLAYCTDPGGLLFGIIQTDESVP